MSKTRKQKHPQTPICPKCGEPHWRHEPCEKLLSTHDFRDRGDPMEKDYGPNHWSNKQDERFDPSRGR